MEENLDISSKNCERHDSDFKNYSKVVPNKKVMKHALRQQVKRRRKNTTIAAGTSRSLPRYVSKTYPSQLQSNACPLNSCFQQNQTVGPQVYHGSSSREIMASSVFMELDDLEEPAVTMKEVLASLPGFSTKCSRRRSAKRLSVPAQLEAGLVDLESPASILTNTSIRALLNRHTFHDLPALYQRKLAQLLPAVDRQDAAISGLNNEFFARACIEWRQRLAEGEFTPENQQKLKLEAEKEKNKLDPWKLKHFEPIWGEKRENKLRATLQMENDHSLHVPINSVLESPESQTECQPVKQISNISDRKNTANNVSIKSDTMSLEILDDDEVDNEEEEDEEDEDDEDDDHENYDDIEEDEEEEEEEDEDDESQNDQSFLQETEVSECMEIVVANIIADQEIIETQNSTESSIIAEQHLSTESQTNNESTLEKGNTLEDKLQIEAISEQIKNETETDKNLPNYADFTNSLKNDNQSQVDQQTENMSESKQFSITDESFCKELPLHTDSVEHEENFFQNSHLNSHENNSRASDDINNSSSGITDVIEIDSETLQRIHELEVRGEMQEAYEEISGCPEEIIYPILGDLEISSENAEISGSLLISESSENQDVHNVNAGPEEEAFQEANNYVCSEMQECSWGSNSGVSGIANEIKDEVQLPWPLVAAALDNSVNTNGRLNHANTICQEKLVVPGTEVTEAVNCISLPQTGACSSSQALTITTPVPTCLVTSIPSTHNSSIIAFPQLQSIQFIQANFQTAQNQEDISEDDNRSVCAYQDVIDKNEHLMHDGLSDNALNMQPRQIITTIQQNQTLQPHFQCPPVSNSLIKLSRSSSGQTHHRSRNSGNHSSSRSRNVTKEPPGVVNLERSYQICQAVIASSPNREQLKARLRPPLSLLNKNEKTASVNKSSNRSVAMVKNQKSLNTNQGAKSLQNKSESLTLRYIVSSVPHNSNDEMIDNYRSNDLETGEINQYVVVTKKTGFGDDTPRASSAPPVQPQVAGMNFGAYIVRGRPASAGDEAVTFKVKGVDTEENQSTDSDTLNNKINSEYPQMCDCNAQGAMVPCRQCGVFCHGECIGPQQLCSSCFTR